MGERDDGRRWAQAASAVDVGDLTAALLAGTGAGRLYVVDHDIEVLVPVPPATGPDVTLTGDLLDAVLAGQPHHDERGTWIPLVDLDVPLGVAWSPPDGRAEGVADPAEAQAAASLAGLVLARRVLVLDGLERLRRRKPMSPAAQLQWDQLATRALTAGAFRAAGTLVPAYDVAGDMFDLAINPDGVLSALVMDAMGHGVTATTSAVLALAAMRTARRQGAGLADQAALADRAVTAEWHGDRFVTMVAIECTADAIRVVNAGHEPMRLVGPGGVRTLDIPAAPPLGVEGPTVYRTTTVAPLHAGEALCLLSDGASEARDPCGRLLGEQGVNALLERCRDGSPMARTHRFARSTLEAIGVEQPADDLAVVVVARAADV